MSSTLATLWPTFGLIVLGALFRRFGFPGDGFWLPAVRLGYFVLLPAVIVRELALAPLGKLAALPMSAALICAILVMTLFLLLARRVMRLAPGPFGSILQGSIRFNTYVALAVVGSLLGPTSSALAALSLAVITPLVNIISVSVLVLNSGHTGFGAQTRRSLLTNPLLLACIVGVALNESGAGLPAFASDPVELLARAALPLGLLTVGAGLVPFVPRAVAGPILLAAGLKLLVLPAVVALFCSLFAVAPEARLVAILFAAMPTGPAGYALALQLRGDAELYAGILTVETLLAAVTLPLVWLAIH